MVEETFKRKLTAILSADVEGYSWLMGEDEDATIRNLTTYRDLMSTLIKKHRGRVVDAPGDNLLAEFGSVVDSVRCAVEIQEELRVRNAELPENRRMQFRIGGNKVCHHIFRNPDGTPEKKNEYLMMGKDTVEPFSPID